jgi:hypothetical protein
MLNSYSMSFDGNVLARGFWLYVWDIRGLSFRRLYVGRTGDSSSPNAQSPFKRIGQHLDPRPNAKGNALGKQLRCAGIDPLECRFEMVAIGPIFPEQDTMEQHKPIRDQVAALERALADFLRQQGYVVPGSHPRPVAPDEQIFAQVRNIVESKFPPVESA